MASSNMARQIARISSRSMSLELDATSPAASILGVGSRGISFCFENIAVGYGLLLVLVAVILAPLRTHGEHAPAAPGG